MIHKMGARRYLRCEKTQNSLAGFTRCPWAWLLRPNTGHPTSSGALGEMILGQWVRQGKNDLQGGASRSLESSYSRSYEYLQGRGQRGGKGWGPEGWGSLRGFLTMTGFSCRTNTYTQSREIRPPARRVPLKHSPCSASLAPMLWFLCELAKSELVPQEPPAHPSPPPWSTHTQSPIFPTSRSWRSNMPPRPAMFQLYHHWAQQTRLGHP